MQKDLKKKIVKVLLVGALAIVPLFPINIYADTTVPVTYNSQSTQSQWSSHLHVTNYCESPLQGSTPCKLTFTLDDNYYGMIGFDGYAGSTLALNYVTVFVTGGIGEYNYRTFSNANPMYINSVNIMGVGLTIPDSNIDLTFIEQLLTSINLYEQSTDNSVSQILQAMLRHDIDVDSFNAWSFFFNYNWFDRDYQDPLATYWYQLQDPAFFNLPYPFMKVGVGENTTTGMVQLQPNLRLYPYGTEGQPHEYIYVGWFASRMQITTANWNTYFYSNNSDKFNVDAERLIASVSYYLDGTPTYLSLWKFRMKPNFTSGNYTAGMRMHGIWNDSITYGYISPVYSGSDLVEGSTGIDFALRYGLNNPVLINLQTIAQGTQQSNTAASDLEDSADDIVQNSNTMFTFENQQNTNMNNALQSINTNFDIGTIGSSFLTSAAWVKTQFDNLTNTTPFGSVLSFSLLLGLALLIIGKVYK